MMGVAEQIQAQQHLECVASAFAFSLGIIGYRYRCFVPASALQRSHVKHDIYIA